MNYDLTGPQLPTDCAATITAKDFDAYGTRYPRHPGSLHAPTHWWTEHAMRWVVEACNGQTVMIDVKGLAWHAQLVGMGHVPGYSTATVILRRSHRGDCTSPRPLPDGREQAPCPRPCKGYTDTAYPIRDVGVIIPLTEVWLDKGAKWRALDAAREAKHPRTVTA